MNVFRPKYRILTDSEKASISDIKDEAQLLYRLLEDVSDPRAKALALTKLEECVMWAVKGITG
jgi:hypothetical protein